MIYFTIALRGKHSTDDWDSVLYDFRNTLRSIYNQTCDDFRVYVGCNEVPQIEESYERLTFVTVNTPAPTSWNECGRDRSWKLLACAHQIKKDINDKKILDDGIFVFPVDADDFISCKIAEYVNLHSDANGFKSKKSYRWVKGTRYHQQTFSSDCVFT